MTDARQVARMRALYGLDKPLLTQYGIYMGKVIEGDFGDSYIQRRPAMRIVMELVPATLKLAVTALVLAVLLGLGLGIMAALSNSRAVGFLLGVLAVVVLRTNAKTALLSSFDALCDRGRHSPPAVKCDIKH